VCQKIQEKIKNDPEKFLTNTQDLWKRLKKYLARYSSNFDSGSEINISVGDEFASMGMSSISSVVSSCTSLNPASLGSIGSQSVRMPPRISTTFESSLEIIFENFHKIPLNKSFPGGKKSSSAPVASKNKLTGEVTYNVDPETLPTRLRGRISSTSVLARKQPQRSQRVSFADQQSVKPVEVFEYPDQEPQRGLLQHPEELLESVREPVSLNNEKTYGNTLGTLSMPLDNKPGDMFADQLLSLEVKPTGKFMLII